MDYEKRDGKGGKERIIAIIYVSISEYREGGGGMGRGE